ncbi:MAG: nucleotide exchange factor GrpE [Rhodospirillaceae bacterium]
MTQSMDPPRPDNQTPPEELFAADAEADAYRDMAMEAAAEPMDEPVDDGPDLVAALQEQLRLIEEERDKFKAEYLRSLADAQNAKRMADKRIEDNSKFAVSNFAKSLLGVADNLQRALLAAPPQERQANPALNNLAVGVEMTEQELQKALSGHGVTRVDSLNQPFDPNFHQAVQEVENTAVPAGTVIQVYQDGYVIQGRLLRAAMVVVSRGGPKREEPAAPEAASEGVDRTV